MQRTNIELDENLVQEAMRLTHKKTKKELVNFALDQLVKRSKRKQLLAMEGRIPWEGDLEESRKSRT